MSDHLPPAGEHPRGTLVLMALYGVLFVAGWFAMYLLVFLRRAAAAQPRGNECSSCWAPRGPASDGSRSRSSGLSRSSR